MLWINFIFNLNVKLERKMFVHFTPPYCLSKRASNGSTKFMPEQDFLSFYFSLELTDMFTYLEELEI